ncbi:DUF4397 domain-containing protein [Mesobacillus maritimus]|uniref:DUF4397 domain-containing protein n=1 Tax=Mesobacillus maritimus TaxID=1643336 RepID=UPI00203F55AD|nr:DUF4397 domain-containing protein [Mesobacillus maritimus]MCM3588659.1 DUF4397 domain-containing protein [Mesobacillus maritimus]MCM3671818.1 DUF4397 domain-containing protein [Mesobacillus maritimus]
MTVNQSQHNASYQAAMYPNLPILNEYHNPSLPLYYDLNKIKNINRKPSSNSKDDKQPANIRIFHSNPICPSLSIQVDGFPFATPLSYREYNHYMCIRPGEHTIELAPTDREISTYVKKVQLLPGKFYTLIVTGDQQKPQVFGFEDHPLVPSGEAKLRFIHLNQKNETYDIAVQNRDVIFSNLSYMNATTYLGLNPMKLNLEIRKAGTNEVVKKLPEFNLFANVTYTAMLSDDEIELVRDYF